MIVDARQMSPGATLRTDVCVVGAGPVGLALSEALVAAGLDVVQLDSGGLEHDAAADSLGEPGEIAFGTVTRLGHTRRIGGNAHAWQIRTGPTNRGVRLLPMSPVDLDPRPGAPGDLGAGWPVTADELAPHLGRAQAWFGLPDRDYEARSWAGPLAEQVVDDPEVRSAVFQFADGGRLAAERPAAAAAAERLRIFHHATAAEVLTDDAGGRATGVRAVTLPGRELTVLADQVVVAAGAMATTQLLLASDRVRPEGLGNGSGHLGRWFMDHLLLQGGELWPADPADIARRTLYDLRVVSGVPIMGHLQPTEEALRVEGLLSLSLLLYPREPGYLRRRALDRRQQDGVRGALEVREALIRRQRPRARALGQAAAGLDGVLRRAWAGGLHPESSLGRGGWSAQAGQGRFVCFEVLHQAEQAPHRDNRVFLSDVRDPLGLRRVSVDWRWHTEDVAATVRAQLVFQRALRRLGWGELRIAEQDGAPVVRSSSSHHFMGTTRMSTHPRDGVVDTRGAVHGVPNLWVASSSVFPTGGFANVTLTTVALALRTADAVIRAAGGIAVVPPDARAHRTQPAGES